jgi:hypothetical protein
LALLLAVGPRRAAAQAETGAADSGDPARAALVVERLRLRGELERVNAEIDRLKRDRRGIGDDYRLRARLADAEALARRLTSLDVQLGTRAGPPPRSETAPREPTAAPTDGPAELEAKADILADEARRLGVQAATLQKRAGQLGARQDLRRRVGQMERDPFSPLEGSRRRTITAAAASSGASAGAQRDSSGAPTTQQPGGVPVSTTPGLPPGGTGAGSAFSAPPAPPTPVGGAIGSDALSAQLRDLLDPTTLAELRRLEASASPATDVRALERAAAALRARAERLTAASKALRARGKTTQPPR